MSKKRFVLVCATSQRSRTVLIKTGAEIAKQEKAGLKVLSVFPEKSCYEPDYEALSELEKCSREHGAQMTVYYDNDPFLVAASVAKQINAQTIVTGFSKDGYSPFINNLHAVLPDIPISMVDDDGKVFRIIPSEVRQKSKV